MYLRDARAVVFTYRQGILAAAGHDLRLTVRFALSVDELDVEATIPLAELRVDGAMRDGVLRPGDLSLEQKSEIERTMAKEVLALARHPHARFAGRVTPRPGGHHVEGELELAGVTRPLAFEAHTEAGGVERASLELVPSRWEIAPYRGLFGALRVQDRVRIELELAPTAA